MLMPWLAAKTVVFRGIALIDPRKTTVFAECLAYLLLDFALTS